MFLTQAEWLRRLDGALETPFFARHADGSLVAQKGGSLGEEALMLDSIPDEEDEGDGWLAGDALDVQAAQAVCEHEASKRTGRGVRGDKGPKGGAGEGAGSHAYDKPMMVMADEDTGNKYMRSVRHKGLGGDGDESWLINICTRS